jgi:hypothetical protein
MLLRMDPLALELDAMLQRWSTNKKDQDVTSKLVELINKIEEKWFVQINITKEKSHSLSWYIITQSHNIVEDGRDKSTTYITKDNGTIQIVFYNDNLIYCPSYKIPLIIDPNKITLNDIKKVKAAVWDIVKNEVIKLSTVREICTIIGNDSDKLDIIKSAYHILEKSLIMGRFVQYSISKDSTLGVLARAVETELLHENTPTIMQDVRCELNKLLNSNDSGGNCGNNRKIKHDLVREELNKLAKNESIWAILVNEITNLPVALYKQWNPIAPWGEPRELAKVLRCRDDKFYKYIRWYKLKMKGLKFRLIALVDRDVKNLEKREKVLNAQIGKNEKIKVGRPIRGESAIRNGFNIIYSAIFRESPPSEEDKIQTIGQYNCPEHGNNCPERCAYLKDFMNKVDAVLFTPQKELLGKNKDFREAAFSPPAGDID